MSEFAAKFAEQYDEIDRLNKVNRELVEALEIVLPMARGYAAEHNVGRNQEMVNEAQAALKEGG